MKNSNFDVNVQLPKNTLTPKSQSSYAKFQKFRFRVEHFCFGNSWISWMLAETMASTFREHFPHYVANGFQPYLVAWEHTHGVHILYLYLTLKKQSMARQARATPAAKFISQAKDDTTILLDFESSVGNIFNRRVLLAILKCPSGLQSVKVKTA
ncbi:hypothetical protein ACB092_01G403800 [Castanea dentata]